MTGVLLVRDPDPERRERTARRAGELLRKMDAGEITDVAAGDHRIVVGSFAGAPVSTATEEGRAAVVVGDRFDPGRDTPTTAADLLAGRVDRRAVADGYHVGIVVDTDETIVQGDPLGYFPMHHTGVGEVALAASSPRLLTAHPSVELRLDLEGLARILLTHGGAEDRTCFAGVARLHFGTRLRIDREGCTHIEPHYRMPSILEGPPRPLDELARTMDDRLVEACRRQLDPNHEHVLLLSGGLDSRHVGSAARAAGRRLRAVTFGASGDFEYQFAQRVAAALDLERHDLVPDRTDTTTFERLLWWEGLHSVPALELGGVSQPSGRLVSGLAFDNLVGGSNVERSYDPVTRSIGVEHFLARMSQRGVGVEGLRSLLRPETFGADAADDVISNFRSEYERSASDDLSRGWVYAMHHNDRHWVGAELARHAFRAWPAIPQLSRSMLDVAADVPIAYIGGRRLQRDMVRLAHPAVASIPLDKTNFDTTAIVPRPGDMVRAIAVRRGIALRRRLRLPVAEKRYYTRILSFDHPDWVAARRRHEPLRARAHELFDGAAFDRLLPPPDTRLAASGYPDSNAAKMLLAVLALLGDDISP